MEPLEWKFQITGDTPLILNPESARDVMRLQIGERHFNVTKATLGNNLWKVLKAHRTKAEHTLRHGRMDREDSDGSNTNVLYFDMDGDIFGHIVSFLRDKVVPTFAMPNGAVDKVKYSLLRDQAVFFNVEGLLMRIPKDWVNDKGVIHKPQLDGYTGASCLDSDVLLDPMWM